MESKSLKIFALLSSCIAIPHSYASTINTMNVIDNSGLRSMNIDNINGNI